MQIAIVIRYGSVYYNMNIASTYTSKQQVQLSGKRYVVCIGRRQPMHRLHKESIEEALETGLKLIYVIGSTNTADSDLYDPINNPLTYEQQIEQFYLTFPQARGNKDITIIGIEDVGNLAIWAQNLVDKLDKLGVTKDCVVHFRGKNIDRHDFDIEIAGQKITLKDSWYIDTLPYFGLSVWYSKNIFKRDYDISSRHLRLYDLNKIGKYKQQQFACYDYIKKLANDAREASPIKTYLEGQKIPVTMIDIGLVKQTTIAKK